MLMVLDHDQVLPLGNRSKLASAAGKQSVVLVRKWDGELLVQLGSGKSKDAAGCEGTPANHCRLRSSWHCRLEEHRRWGAGCAHGKLKLWRWMACSCCVDTSVPLPAAFPLLLALFETSIRSQGKSCDHKTSLLFLGTSPL